MIRRLAFFSLFSLVALPQLKAQEAQPPAPFGTIERFDVRLDALIPKNAVLEKVANGFDWSEGPVWLTEEKALVFSDVPMNTVYRYKAGEPLKVYVKPSGFTGTSTESKEQGSNGLLFDPVTKKLVLCQHGDRRVARLESDGKFTTLADGYQGKRFNSPNDGVYKSNGELYFTDPPYGLARGNEDPRKEIPYNGVYRLKKDGSVTLLTKELSYPNGIGFSPDEKILYVAVSDPKKAIWMSYPVEPEGTVGAGKVFFDATAWAKSKKGLPDGLKVDAKGNIWATGPGGVLIFAADGTHLGTINTGEATANVGWGEDGTVLYITADMYLGRLKTTTKGIGF